MKVREFLTDDKIKLPIDQPIKLITILGEDPVEYGTKEKLLESHSKYLDRECIEFWQGAIDKNCISIRISVI